MMGSLSAAQQQLKSRSKMHEMAVRQRLITDQVCLRLVQLSAEERRTLLQEGYPVPTRLPLSKAEEESLKIVRRKIKNKLSAQESRRKRKEYMDTLESRCQAYFNENSQLKSELSSMNSICGLIHEYADL
ncbi:unnamed protein product [Haemonchus placei]|uniref:BZIP domain-containing protein n=1 Tax=Haemonchus placei TaxID=6290 RepID=A0A0N4W580_HAEPC|nr:unnamed protein product [Haemonchus placei]